MFAVLAAADYGWLQPAGRAEKAHDFASIITFSSEQERPTGQGHYRFLFTISLFLDAMIFFTRTLDADFADASSFLDARKYARPSGLLKPLPDHRHQS